MFLCENRNKVLGNSKRGQAMLEYLIVFAFVILITLGFVRKIELFFSNQMGNFSDVLSSHLSTGVCDSTCLYSGYSNGSD